MQKSSPFPRVWLMGSLVAVSAWVLPGCGAEWGSEADDELPRASDGDTPSAPGISEASVSQEARGGRLTGYRVVVMFDAVEAHEPTAINNRGQISGSALNSENVRQAWFWDGAQAHFIVGDRPEATGVATDVSNAGVVVGGTQFWRSYSEMPDSFRLRTRGFVWEPGVLQELGLRDGNSMSRAEGINRHGDVVGTSYGGTGEQQALLFFDDQVVTLGMGVARAVNRDRQVVGALHLPETRHAFLYSQGALSDLGTLGGEYTDSSAVDINDAGTIVGESTLVYGGPWRAFVYRDGVMTELPLPGENSSAVAINRASDIVGSFGSSDAAVSEGYLFRGEQVHVLKDIVEDGSCWTQLEPRDINDHGDIVGVGTRSSEPACGAAGRYLVVITQRPQRYQR